MRAETPDERQCAILDSWSSEAEDFEVLDAWTRVGREQLPDGPAGDGGTEAPVEIPAKQVVKALASSARGGSRRWRDTSTSPKTAALLRWMEDASGSADRGRPEQVLGCGPT